jgi:hypothetical protein
MSVREPLLRTYYYKPTSADLISQWLAQRRRHQLIAIITCHSTTRQADYVDKYCNQAIYISTYMAISYSHVITVTAI